LNRRWICGQRHPSHATKRQGNTYSHSDYSHGAISIPVVDIALYFTFCILYTL
jgi:hypothetical protein